MVIPLSRRQRFRRVPVFPAPAAYASTILLERAPCRAIMAGCKTFAILTVVTLAQERANTIAAATANTTTSVARHGVESSAWC